MKLRALAIGTLLVLTAIVLPPNAQAETHSGADDLAVVVEHDIEIPTRSGHVLRADLYRPAREGVALEGLPTIVTYFPYVKDDSSRFEIEAMQQFARAGYAGLLVDIPGTGASMGSFGFLSEREIADGRDAVDWAAAQPFSNGRTGLWGYSYPGLTAAHIATTQPPSLKAVVPASSFNDAYRDVVAPGGILTTQDGVLLPFLAAFNVLRQRPDTDPQIAFEELLDSAATPGGLVTLAEAPTHGFYDDYWKERALENKIHRIEVPTLLWSSWADIYPRGTLLNHHMIGAEHVRLVMGPWGHLSGVMDESLQLFIDESLSWFDTFLRNDPDATEADAATGAKIFDIDWNGDDVYAGVWPGRFETFASWPPSVEDTTFALCATPESTPGPEAPWAFQGALAETCPDDGALPVLPLPVDATGGGSIGHDATPNPYGNFVWDDKDQRISAGSTAFLTTPLAAPATITGAMHLELTADTVGVDADWVVRVVDVGPQQTRVIAPGWLRASRRRTDPDRGVLWHTHDRTDPLSPAEPYELDIEIWPSSYRIPAGHRLGVLLRTADTLKVAPGGGQLVSNVRTGPGAISALRVPLRVEPGPVAAPAAPADPGTAAPPGAEPPSPRILPATGDTLPRAQAAIGLALAGLFMLLLRIRPRHP